MIVQYVIDWHYVRSLTRGATGNGDKLEVIRQQLKFLRSGVMRNGVLFAAENPSFLCELQNIIREDLKQTAGGEAVSSWTNLSNELRAWQKAYDDKCIRLPIQNAQNSFETILGAREQMLAEANLSMYDLPCAIITDQNVGADRNTVSMTLDQYENSLVEECRAKWADVSFGVRENYEADRFWAGLSMGASGFKLVSIIDPYCLRVVFRDGGKPLDNWNASMDWIMGFFIRNKFVEKITLVGEGKIAGHTLHIGWLRDRLGQRLSNLIVHRNGKFTVGIRVILPTRDWHNRWIDIGIATCACDDGLEVYKRDGDSIVIGRPFQVRPLGDNGKAQFKLVAGSRSESYQDIVNGKASVDIEDVEGLRPSDPNNAVEFDVWPPIVINR